MLSVLAIASAVLTNAASLAEAVCEDRVGLGFEIEGVVTLPNTSNAWHMAVEDDSGGVMLRNHSSTWKTAIPQLGERVRLYGRTTTNKLGIVFAQCTQVVGRASLQVPVPTRVSVAEFMSGRFDNKLVSMSGIVREAFRDEIDPIWIYVIVNCEGSRIAAVFKSGTYEIAELAALTDASVVVSGLCYRQTHGIRRLLGRHIVCFGPESIKVAVPAPADPFDVPAIVNEKLASPIEVDQMGRRRMCGTVTAVWSDRHFLLEDSNGANHRIELADGGPPGCGECVEATGVPSTDLYRIHLGGALWRPATNEAAAAKGRRPPVLTIDDFHSEQFGRLYRFMLYNGRTARFTGTVVSVELGDVKYRNCTIRCEDFTIVVNSGTAGDFPEDIAIDSQVEVTGTCVISSGIWHPSVTFPHIEDAPMVVMRRPGDMKIVASPPWWTPLRLVVAIGILLVLLAAIILWAITLKVVAERRGRQLFRTQIDKAAETLRVEERTRLAVELHDTIAQNLTGAAYQIDAAKDATAPESEASSYLACAKQILKSCRTELRRCIWDLKSNSLEEPNLDKAVLATVRPVVGGADVRIRFNVPRNRLSDVTTHALLQIIRELVANAVRHGRATKIRIAGEFSDDRLHFSVSDNGCGFDPDSCPGPSSGHFGLDGIRERIDKLGGELRIESSPENGAKATISLLASRQSQMSHTS